jgi:hypothetical protein
MAYIRFSFLLLIAFISNTYAQTRFSPKACLDSHYKMRMIQKGPLFGLLKHEFIINKKECNLTITYRKYFPREWKIDVCREPVHIKVTSATGVDVAKKTNECINKDKSRDTGDFCGQYFDLIDVIQDEGLIFAEGDRDNLSSDHGKTYCSYLLIRRYLLDSVVFSRYTEVQEIFEAKPMIPKTPVRVEQAPLLTPAPDRPVQN